MLLGGVDGIFLPLVHIESQVLGGILYFIGLIWCFQGVGIISDIFMNAIEKITSAKKQVRVKRADSIYYVSTGSGDAAKGQSQLRTVKVWNDTVANLTLMALGSSAPEIMLSVIELAPNKMRSGSLGPSTIVGSAAFNLLIITAVCVSAIPDGESRRVKDISVFAVTASFSIFAYLWLIVILVLVTPDVVTPIEGLLTIVFLPILVTLAYLADIGWFHKVIGAVKPRSRLVFSPDTTREEYARMMDQLKQKYPILPTTDEEMHVLLRYEFPENITRAARRIEATRGLAGRRPRAAVHGDHHLRALGERVSKGLRPAAAARGSAQSGQVYPEGEGGQLDHKPSAIFEHVADRYAVSEAAKEVCLTVRRVGNEQIFASCKIRTVPGTAEANKDYVPLDEQLDFLPAETEKTINIKILEDKKVEGTEEFYVELVPIQGKGIVGFTRVATVIVLDSDAQGKLRFEEDAVIVLQQAERVTKRIKVERVGGCVGDMRCAYRTEDLSAKAGKDFEETSGVLEFPEGVTHTFIEVTILPLNSLDTRNEVFFLIIEPCDESEITGEGHRLTVCFDETTDGGSLAGICTITIQSDATGEGQYSACLASMASRGWLNMDNVEIGTARWREQLAEALYVGGSPESQADAGPVDWALHVVGVPWKVLFAAVPPTEFCGGKACFACSLLMIGICTAFIGDLANLLGCALDIPPSICAITFVALGTSLPDTFASRTAAMQDPTADNSIGNVTGSNSVNVFLGLGLSWFPAAVYWEFNGEDFEVDAGSLGPSVAVFCGCALACIALLLVRRWVVGAELGGPVFFARVSSAFLVSLWIMYIVLSVIIEESA